jgi:CheY-like chemotaxis protein
MGDEPRGSMRRAAYDVQGMRGMDAPFGRAAGAGLPERASRPSRSGLMRRPWRVLIVDDEIDIRELCTEYLTTAGYEVLQAENGAEGIEVATERMPDVIVMDVEMPVVGGLEAIQRLGADARTRAIPVILLSASAIAEHNKAERLGCTVCLVKPCDPFDLEGIIRTLVETKRQQPSARA